MEIMEMMKTGTALALLLFAVACRANSAITIPVETQTRPADGMVMVSVPAGEFGMGSTDDELEAALELCSERFGCNRASLDDEQPMHTVMLASFWIDQTEVTNAHYRQCVEAGACDPPQDTRSYSEPWYYDNPAFDDAPVIYVTWHQAAAYCAWAGGRLPTEAEWEYAARGPERRVFPWGDEFDSARSNICDTNCDFERVGQEGDDGFAEAAPVGRYPNGASWCAVLDLAGNVWEWVADWYDAYPSARQVNPTGPASGETRVVRGGSWAGGRDHARAAVRDHGEPDRAGYGVGFRCALSANP
jgi:formylglycine-generating enzyme required for sulfatase activity